MHSRRSLCVLAVLAAAIICDLTVALPSVRVKRQDEPAAVEEAKSNDLNPIDSQDGDLSEIDRNKRKVPDAAFEAKNAVLGFVFGEDNLVDDYMLRSGRATVSVNGKDNDVPVFNRDMVSLDIPDQLFSQSFSTLTNVSKIASRFIMNSARRYARFILFFKPLFGDALTVEGFNPPTTTTEKSS